ncbi:MAG: hypothetical protein ABH885_01865, partial [Candidatus Omnitrophota bacterium]
MELLDRFNLQGVRYVVVGMSGINYYASGADETFSTQDFDIFVKPTISNVEKAVSAFLELGYSLTVEERNLNGLSLKDVVKNKRTVLAADAYGIAFDMVLAVSGFTFAGMERDAKVFRVGKIPIKVGRLPKL